MLHAQAPEHACVQAALEAVVDGLLSVLVTLGIVPIIRCPKVCMRELLFHLQCTCSSHAVTPALRKCRTRGEGQRVVTFRLCYSYTHLLLEQGALQQHFAAAFRMMPRCS